MRGEDFVHVRLSAAGEKLADGAPVHIGGGNYHFTFHPGESQRVTRAFDWVRVLSNEQIDGEPMFELAEPPAPAVVVKKTAAEEKTNAI
jgi:hypothetical protein